MRGGTLTVFLAAARRFSAAPSDLSAMNKLVSARLYALDMGVEAEPWPSLTRVLMALATAVQDSAGREDRRAAIAEIMALALDRYEGDLGDNVIAAPIRQYSED